MALPERFWAKVQKTEGCWIWTAATKSGYGHFVMGGRYKSAHVLIWEDCHGPIEQPLNPEKGMRLQIDHLCRMRLCVNPSHLELVTQKENLLRGVSPPARNARKSTCPSGHPYDEMNTYTNPTSGYRQCRRCTKARSSRK